MKQSPSRKTWFVTGASAGFGRALVKEILSRGDQVVAAMRNLASAPLYPNATDDQLLKVQLDVTNPREIAAAVGAAINRFGAIDVLINNAGYGFLSTIEEADDEAVRRQFETNVFGPAALMRAVLPGMRSRRQGFVVNISSTAGARGFSGSGYYSASKAALEALTEALAAEAAPLGIRALIVCPGPFRTDFFGRSIAMPDCEIADYAGVLEMRRSFAASDGTQSGDPARGAKIIVDTVLDDQPPTRLVLGGKALPTIVSALKTKIADLGRSEALAPTADFPAGE